jgi:DNA-binding response OmpR family regulator
MKAQERILVVDDEQAVRQVLSTLLETEGFSVIEASDAKSCLHLVYEQHPDLVLLDILMPDRDGRDVCRLLRDIDTRLPIVMLTAVSDKGETVGRLEDGADDYITKPFHNHELVARIRTVLRRAHRNTLDGSRTYQDSQIKLDFAARQFLTDKGEVALSPKEWRLLECLVEHKGRAVTHEELLRYAWGNGYEGEQKYVKVYVSHLRRKLGDNPKKPRYIHTVREQGYLFEVHA